MGNSQNTYNKTYSIGTSQFSYMVVAILTVVIFYLVAYFAPTLLTSVWTITGICILYCVLLFLVYIKGEKLILTKDAIQIKGWFLQKKILIKEIKSFKVLAPAYTAEKKIIRIHHKNNKSTTINSLPNSDFDAFVNWLESEVKKEDELHLDPIQKKILQHNAASHPNVLNQNKTLKTYIVGKNFLAIFILFSILISGIPLLLFFLGQNDASTNNTFMYIQIIAVLLLITAFIIYIMFVHNKLLISTEALTYKGLFKNKKLKFSEIKGFKIAYTLFFKRYQYIVIVSNIDAKRNIILRPTNKTSFIELADWIEKNLRKIE